MTKALPWQRVGAYTEAGIVSGLANLVLFHLFHLALGAHLPPHAAWALCYESGAVLAFALHWQVTWRDNAWRGVRSPCGILPSLTLVV